MSATAPPPAWYPDPATPGLMRWWDGYQWTQHQQPATPVSEQAAPAVATATRTAPALPPTGVLIEATLQSGAVRSKRLVVTAASVRFGSDEVRLADITGVAYWQREITYALIPAATHRFVDLSTPAGALRVPFINGAAQKRAMKEQAKANWLGLIELLEHLVEPRLCDEALAGIEAGTAYPYRELSLDRDGLTIRRPMRAPQVHPWSSLTGTDLRRGQIHVLSAGGQSVARMSMSECNAVLLPELIPRGRAAFGAR
jgi:hypothetical protein